MLSPFALNTFVFEACVALPFRPIYVPCPPLSNRTAARVMGMVGLPPFLGHAVHNHVGSANSVGLGLRLRRRTRAPRAQAGQEKDKAHVVACSR
eukprot:9499963-Lingulodinium_polyedra.AAC.1